MKKLKRLFAALAVLSLVLLAFPLCAFAEEADAPTENAAGGAITEEPTGEPETPETPETPESPETPPIDYDKIAGEVYDRVKEDLPKGLAENIMRLIEDWEKTNKEDATFTDRIKEFFEPDNLVSTISMLFMVIVGLVVYGMKRRQGLSISGTNKDLNSLKSRIEEQCKDGREIGAGVGRLIESLDKITEFLDLLEKKFDGSQSAAEQARCAAIGVATMLKDIFQNSRTIDEAGKKIMNLDYLKAVGEAIDLPDDGEKEEKAEV